MENNKRIKKTLFIMPLIILTTLIKYLLGYRYVLIADGIVFVIVTILFLLYFIMKNHNKILRIKIYFILFYSLGLGVLMPAFEFIDITRTLLYGLLNIIPLVFYFLILKNRKVDK